MIMMITSSSSMSSVRAAATAAASARRISLNIPRRHNLLGHCSRQLLSSSSSSSSLSSVVVDNPYTGDTYCEVARVDTDGAKALIASAADRFDSFRFSPLSERIALCSAFCDEFELRAAAIATDISGQMGKPLSQATGEVSTMLARARTMIELAPRALADEVVESSGSVLKKIVHEPLGPVLVVAPWNYPLLCAVNAVIPAVLAGNTVLLKHSYRTPLCAEHFTRTFAAVDAPPDLVQSMQGDHALIAEAIRDPAIGFVNFTGSVDGGHSIYRTVSERFIDAGLELGGNDAAYVAADADIKQAAAGLMDGAFYNAGQSCCGIQRVYVHASVYDAFVDESRALASGYTLGDPMHADTTMGPLAQPNSAHSLTAVATDARRHGGRVLCGGSGCSDASGRGRFFAPTLVVDANSTMKLMHEEAFGPLVGVERVDSDEHAIELMNNSPYGLTSAVFTSDRERALAMAPRLNTGTVFMNKCDFPDAKLPWSGRKDSGKGVGLSHHGFRSYTLTKSYNFAM